VLHTWVIINDWVLRNLSHARWVWWLCGCYISPETSMRRDVRGHTVTVTLSHTLWWLDATNDRLTQTFPLFCAFSVLEAFVYPQGYHKSIRLGTSLTTCCALWPSWNWEACLCRTLYGFQYSNSTTVVLTTGYMRWDLIGMTNSANHSCVLCVDSVIEHRDASTRCVGSLWFDHRLTEFMLRGITADITWDVLYHQSVTCHYKIEQLVHWFVNFNLATRRFAKWFLYLGNINTERLNKIFNTVPCWYHAWSVVELLHVVDPSWSPPVTR